MLRAAIQTISRYLSPNPEPAQVLHPVLSLKDIPRYPPFDRGLPLITVQDIVRSQQEIIDRIEKTSGMTPADFNLRMMPVIENLAKYVHLLPATSNGHHRGAGGLFRLALEIGLYSLQIANASVFINKGTVSVEARFRLQPKWAYATFLAAVCSDVYRPITTMVVVDDEGDKWPQLLTPLFTWATQRNKERYFIVWNIQDEVDVINLHQASSAYLINAIIPASSLQWINEDNSEIVSTMTACITGAVKSGVSNQIFAITSQVKTKVIERDIKSSSDRYGAHLVGSHLEPHLIDAMRRLVRNGTWGVNDKGARIWHSNEGVFLVWKPASKEIIKMLTDDNQPGIPQDADTLAEILLSSGISDRNDDDGCYWEIVEPNNMSILTAIKVRRPEIIFPDDYTHALLDNPVLVKNISKKIESEQQAQAKANSKKRSSAQESAGPQPQPPVASDEATSIPTAASAAQNNNIDDTQSTMEFDETVGIMASGVTSPPLVAESSPAIAVETAVQIDAPPKKEKKPRAAKTVKEQIQVGSMAKGLLGSLQESDSQLMQLIIEDYVEKESQYPVFCADSGMAISTKEIEVHGNSNYFGLVKALHDKGWLWVDPEMPMRKVHDLAYDGKTYPCLVLREEIARGMGFDWKKPRKD